MDRLGELVVVAGDLLHLRLNFRHQVRLELARVGPLITRLDHHEGVSHRRRHRVGGDLSRTNLRPHSLHFWELQQTFFHDALHAQGLGHAGAGNTHGLKREVALIQAGNKLATHARGEQPTANQQGDRTDGHQLAATQAQIQQRFVAPTEPAHQPVLFLFDLATEQHRHGSGHEGQGQDHRARQRQHHGDGHRVEHLSFHTGQGKDRQVDGGDDAQTEQARSDHFGRCAGGHFKTLFQRHLTPEFMLTFAKATQAVLDDDDRAVHDQAEVQRAQAHQVGRHATARHTGQGEQHRQWNHRSRDQSSSEVA